MSCNNNVREKTLLNLRIRDVKHPSFLEEGIHLNFPVLRSKHHQKALDTSELEPVTKFLKGFLSRQFIETFSRAQVEALVSRWVPFCGWTYPCSLHGGNYDSMKFKTFVVSVTFAAILEDLFELNTNKSFGDPEKMKKLIAAVSDILQESVNPEENGGGKRQHDGEVMEMLETETIFIQILSMSSELFDMQKYCCKEGEYEKHFKPQIVEDLIKVVGQTGWRKQEDVSQYSELTYRNHRNGLYGTEGIISLLCALEGVRLNQKFKSNCQLKALVEIGTSICSGISDILSIKRDVAKADTPNIILYKLKKNGNNFRRAIEDEITLLTEKLDDYLRTRLCLLKSLQDLESGEKDVLKFVEILDSFVDGNTMALANTKIFAHMQEDVSFEE